MQILSHLTRNIMCTIFNVRCSVCSCRHSVFRMHGLKQVVKIQSFLLLLQAAVLVHETAASSSIKYDFKDFISNTRACTFHLVQFSEHEVAARILRSNQYGQPWTVTGLLNNSNSTSASTPRREFPPHLNYLRESRHCNVHLLAKPKYSDKRAARSYPDSLTVRQREFTTFIVITEQVPVSNFVLYALTIHDFSFGERTGTSVPKLKQRYAFTPPAQNLPVHFSLLLWEISKK